jgi:GH24 family phage-related lysozyme (muramidase)
MKTSDQGLTILIDREAKRNKAYLDSVGVPTIGVGHTGPEVHMGLVWTDDEVKAAFAQDIQRFEQAVTESCRWSRRSRSVTQPVLPRSSMSGTSRRR